MECSPSVCESEAQSHATLCATLVEPSALGARESEFEVIFDYMESLGLA